MKTINVASWSAFIEEVERLNARKNEDQLKVPWTVIELLYRGQADAEWHLDTTLERLVHTNIPLVKYYKCVLSIKAKIESVTERKWQIPSLAKFEGWRNKQTDIILDWPGGDYLAYLRHHGFPSPLLDWTKSPYIAAYFAMVNAPQKEVEEVSVFAYLQSGHKVVDTEVPVIQFPLGKNVVTHKRHYLQQSMYTICTQRREASHFYANHENVVSRNEDRQDSLWRINIPISQRPEFLSKLEAMNINSFSLFETEDKLMEHLAVSEILLGGLLSEGGGVISEH
jgi:hypothetical protein